jgi:hypothetical protein
MPELFHTRAHPSNDGARQKSALPMEEIHRLGWLTSASPPTRKLLGSITLPGSDALS